jgi:hypothetical protein
MIDSAGLNSDNQFDPRVYKGGSYSPQYDVAQKHKDHLETPTDIGSPRNAEIKAPTPLETSR